MAEQIPRPPLTKIIATLGPASSDEETIRLLVEAGVSVFRINFSHGTPEEHAERVRFVRSAAAALRRPVGILGDLPGPKIRVEQVAGEGVVVPTGAIVTFQRESIVARPDDDPVRFSSTYERLVDDVAPGDRLLVNDGKVRMLVVDRDADRLRCTVTHGGRITTGKGINLPDSELECAVITVRDRKWAAWAVEHDLDYLGLSFVRHRKEIEQLRALVAHEAQQRKRRDFSIFIVAKIERRGAVDDIEEIVDGADIVMIARGDLGVEMDLAQVPVIQKKVIAVARAAGRPCIVATQMLETMIDNPQPTRAEASDVASAIFDEVDAVMLSGETAVGRFPVVTVETMRRIAEATETYLAEGVQRSAPPRKLQESRDPVAALAHGVWTVAQDTGARHVVIWSQSGGGARLLSQNHFCIPIAAVSSDERALRRMQLLRGVHPVHMDVPRDLAAFTSAVDEHLMELGWARDGDPCVLVSGWPLGVSRVSNTIAIHEVANPETGFAWHSL